MRYINIFTGGKDTATYPGVFESDCILGRTQCGRGIAIQWAHGVCHYLVDERLVMMTGGYSFETLERITRYVTLGETTPTEAETRAAKIYAAHDNTPVSA